MGVGMFCRRHSTTDLPKTQALGLHSRKQIRKKRLLNSTTAGEVDVQLLTDVLGPTPALNRAKGSERAPQNPFDDADPGANQNPFDDADSGGDKGDEDDHRPTAHGAGGYRPSTESRTLFGRSVAVYVCFCCWASLVVCMPPCHRCRRRAP